MKSGLSQFPSTSKSDVLSFDRGLDLVNQPTQMEIGALDVAKNMEYRKNRLAKRRPFVAKSNTTYTYGFEGGAEYLDTTDTRRILFADSNGNIKEFVDADNDATRVSGLTTDARTRFASVNGVVFSVNGSDALQRGDGTSWRVGGSPAKVTNVALASGSGTNMVTGTYLYIVIAVIQVSGVGAVFSEFSDVKSITLVGADSVDVTWTATTDARVTHYYIYRTKADLGTPYYYEGKVTVGTETYASDTLDESLTQVWNDTDWGVAPIGEIIRSSNKRLIIGKISGAPDELHLSQIATDKYEMEGFPNDGIHRFKLPGQGSVTAIFSYSVKDEEGNRDDLFLAQRNSCYVLRGTDPDSPLDTISTSVGVVSPDAIAQWGRFLFFVSIRGLEFLGPSGQPLLISDLVNPIFEGGGTLNYPGITEAQEQYLNMVVWENRLILTLQDDATNAWGNKALVLDLEKFDPMSYTPENASRFTLWEQGPGMAFFISATDGELILFDNENKRMLKRATGTEFKDQVGANQVVIDANFRSGGLLAQEMAYRKSLRYINAYVITDLTFHLDVTADYGNRNASVDMPIESIVRDWNKIWDKEWNLSQRWLSTRNIPRKTTGQFMQFSFTAKNNSVDFIFIGMTIYYTSTEYMIMRKR